MTKIWLNSYPSDIPGTINFKTFDTLADALLSYCEEFDSLTAFSGFKADLSYAELEENSRHLASFWQMQGLKKGDRIAFIMPNILQYPIAFLAAIRIGLIVVNINPMYKAAELLHVLNDSQATAVVLLDLASPALTSVIEQTSVSQVYTTSIADFMIWPLRSVVNSFSRLRRRLVRRPFPAHVKEYQFRRCLKSGQKVGLKPVVLRPNDTVVLQYTSGTTGQAKGAMLTNNNLLSNIYQCLTWMRSALTPKEEVVLAALPLYHIFSLTVCGLSFLAIGAKVQLIADPRRLNSLIRTMHKTPLTVFIGLNTLFQSLLNRPKFAYANFSQLKLTIAGGMPTKLCTAKRWKQTTGCVVLEGYGLTEASPVVSINPLGSDHFVGSVGLPIPNTDIKITDSSGLSVSPGKVGELCVKGPQVMKGYWQREEETNEAIEDGWLKTGDLARMDEQGYLYIVDRKKDMILVSGFNVFPNEVEETISQYSDVAEVAVVGKRCESSGEAVIAYVVPKKGIDIEALKSFCRENMVAYKVPSEFHVVRSIPKSSVGKVLRRKLSDC